jgi:hypothetical protein
MSTTVTLGFVKLQSFEVPTAIGFGGRQRMAVHDLPGGGRVIDVLGGADDEIVFNGIISGQDADTRAQLLDALRISGASVPLSWDEQYFIVIIAEARFEYRKSWWIPYQLRCVVQSNLIYGAAATAASAAFSVATDLAQAATSLDVVPASLTKAEASLAETGATTPGTAAYGTSLSDLTAAQGSLANGMTASGAAMPGFDLSLAGQNPPAAAISLTGITTAAGSLAAQTSASAYLGRGLATLAQIGG